MPDPITNPTTDLKALLGQAFRLVTEEGRGAPEGLSFTIQATADVLTKQPDRFYSNTTLLTEARNIVDLVAKQGDVVNQRRATRVARELTQLLQIDPTARLEALGIQVQRFADAPPPFPRQADTTTNASDGWGRQSEWEKLIAKIDPAIFSPEQIDEKNEETKEAVGIRNRLLSFGKDGVILIRILQSMRQNWWAWLNNCCLGLG